MMATQHLTFIFGVIILLGTTERANGIPDETAAKAEVDNVKKLSNISDPNVPDDTNEIPKITTPKAKADNGKKETTASDPKDLNGNNLTLIIFYFIRNTSYYPNLLLHHMLFNYFPNYRRILLFTP